MKKNSKKLTIAFIALVALVSFSALIIHNYKTKTSFKYSNQKAEEFKPEEKPQDAVNAAVKESAANPTPSTSTERNNEILKVLPADFVLGSQDAPVVMIEYASLSCPHCATFVRESFEKLKSEYIDSGKVKFVYRDFPLNQSALIASMFALCQANDNKSELPEKYYVTLKALFKTQDSWAFDEKYAEKLESIARLDGMSAERFKSCINDRVLQEKVLNMRMEAAKALQIKSTPAFFINGEVSEGYIDYLTLKNLIEKKLAEVKN